MGSSSYSSSRKKRQEGKRNCEKVNQKMELLLSSGGPVKLSAFRRRVYRALVQVPAGKVTTYGKLGDMVGCKSAQAIGQALKGNPHAPTIPCHRVVQTDRKLGGFAGQTQGVKIDKKILLLKEEGVLFQEDGRIHPDCIYEFRQEKEAREGGSTERNQTPMRI